MMKLKGLWLYLLKHKIISSFVIIILAIGGYFGYGSLFGQTGGVSYVTSKAAKDMIISTVSGSGTVAASSEVDLKTKASSEVTAIKVKKGETVKAGAVLIQLNAKDAAKAVRDAQANLDSAKLSLDKLTQPIDALSLAQAQNTLAQAKESKDQAQANIDKAYEDAYNTISDAFLDLPTIIAGLYEVQYGSSIGTSEPTVGGSQDNAAALLNSIDTADREKISALQVSAASDYNIARAAYDKNFDAYKIATRFSDTTIIEALLDQTLETTKSMAQSAKSESNLLDSWVTYRTDSNWTIFSSVKTMQTSLADYISKTGSHANALLAIKTTLTNNRTTLVNTDRTINEKTLSLADLQAGTSAIDLKSSQLSVQQKQNSLADAMEQYANYTIKAPFDGVVANVAINLGDTVASGASAITLITTQKIANLSLNEVDAAKVKVGQKAMITFDAITDLTVAGSVADMDMLGTVTQGVASYAVKIAFDSQNDQIKSGMTASASIVIDSKADALQVPSSAVKSASDGTNYVQVLVDGAPQNKTVTVGLTSDTMTEILSGISDGDEVVTQIVTATNKAAAKTSISNNRPSGGMMMGL
ncbi:MAG: efflux RND transporter periplasmic adaptor subunit [Patescibacteria group bacterium]